LIRSDSATASPPLTVSELAFEIRRRLQPLAAVLVKGEVSGMKALRNGHYGFTIRDRGAVVEAFLFAGDARRLPMLPEDGQEFIFRGRVDFWPQGGRLRLIVDWVEFDDVGKLRAQFEQLKQRLESEGAFDSARKRPLPFLPLRVALVTSPTGAVIHDLQETILERYSNMDISVYPAQVQGTAAAGSVVTALRRCNADAVADVVVIARGGGSFEELYAFNTEPVARAILVSRIPVVTALGHTSDRTLADMVADAECRTPTEAGARVVPRKADLERGLGERSARLDRAFGGRLDRLSDALGARAERLSRAPGVLLERRAERLRRFVAELARLRPADQLARRRTDLAERERRLHAAAGRVVRGRAAELERRRPAERLQRLLAERLRSAARVLADRERRLAALSPDGVLARGYSIASDEETGRVLRDASESAPGRRVRVRLGRGALRTRVESQE
jgi:exodeoxyribonuclease VII large subunit